ncbi:hypothetical protein C5167_013456 [Papaver somniferum]|uniref:Alcohol dehydrogenase-like C-terminal domain-containing protein n=1 Tax=Papaver somniferum TaxID=3469 RepID=A0A4Y7J1D5_PAPSO|nr:hypothetical protein C5167_013456 [Papaver somniferum]
MGVDIAVEALGLPQTFLQCTQSVRDGGKAVMIALAPTGVIGEIDITRLVRRQVKIIGSYGARARQDLPKIVKLAEKGVFTSMLPFRENANLKKQVKLMKISTVEVLLDELWLRLCKSQNICKFFLVFFIVLLGRIDA